MTILYLHHLLSLGETELELLNFCPQLNWKTAQQETSSLTAVPLDLQSTLIWRSRPFYPQSTRYPIEASKRAVDKHQLMRRRCDMNFLPSLHILRPRRENRPPLQCRWSWPKQVQVEVHLQVHQWKRHLKHSVTRKDPEEMRHHAGIEASFMTDDYYRLFMLAWPLRMKQHELVYISNKYATHTLTHTIVYRINIRK